MVTTYRRFVAETKRLEGLQGVPTKREMYAHSAFAREPLTVTSVHRIALAFSLLTDSVEDTKINSAIFKTQLLTPREIHDCCLRSKPFDHGNGIYARAMWLRMMVRLGAEDIALKRGFLASFYLPPSGPA